MKCKSCEMWNSVNFDSLAHFVNFTLFVHLKDKTIHCNVVFVLDS